MHLTIGRGERLRGRQPVCERFGCAFPGCHAALLSGAFVDFRVPLKLLRPSSTDKSGKRSGGG